MGDPRDLGVLLRHSLHRVDEQYHDIRALHRAHGAHDHIVLEILLHLVLAAQPCGVDKNVFSAVSGDGGIHRIPGGARDIGDDQPVFPQKLIDQGGLAHVGLAYDGDPGFLVLPVLLALLPEMSDHHVQHIPQPHLIGGGDGIGLADSQIVELVHIGHILFKAVHLVDHQDHRLMRAPQHVRHPGVRVHQPLPDIHHKKDHIRRVDGDLGLLSHLG